MSALPHQLIKPGPRPFIALGMAYGAILAVLAGVFFLATGSPATEAAKCIGFVLFLSIVITLNVWRTRIVISTDSLLLYQVAGSVREVRFRDIIGSVAEYPYGSGTPRLLNIYVKERQWPAITLSLKPYREEDVRALLSLPALKVSHEEAGGVRISAV